MDLPVSETSIRIGERVNFDLRVTLLQPYYSFYAKFSTVNLSLTAREIENMYNSFENYSW